MIGLPQDQAENLRKLVRQKAQGVDLGFNNTVVSLFGKRPMFAMLGDKSEIVSFCNIVMNVGIGLARANRRILILEDFDQPINCACLAGVSAPEPLISYGSAQASWEKISNTVFDAVRLMRGMAELENINNWEHKLRAEFVDKFKGLLNQENQIVLASETSPRFSMVASDVIAIFSPGKERIISMYKQLKTICEVNPGVKLHFVINNAESDRQIKQFCEKFQTTIKEFINKEISFLGAMTLLPEVVRSIKAKKPLVLNYSYSKATVNINDIVLNILREAASRRLTVSNKALARL